ncbi:MAG: hypothetical protein LLG06_12600 [Desulfobacteraceae bacterium]|nr:hypothetical protein [Desulfobacteraceae bacterium]
MKADRECGRKAAGIIRYYRSLYGAGPEESGDSPYRITSAGAWAASRPAHLFSFFRRLNLSEFRLFLDVGSGDGIAVCLAGLLTRAVGIESDHLLASRARRASLDLGLDARVDFICADFFTQQIRHADCLYIYPDKPIYGLEDALEGWNGTLLVYGPHFAPRKLAPAGKLRCGKETIAVYRSPLRSISCME